MTYLIVARPCYHHLATKSHPSDNAAVERQQLRSFGKIMTSDLDIFRTANVLIREHGEDAAPEAAKRDAMLEKGSVDGQRLWKRVLKAVKEIQRQEPREDEAVN